MSPTSHPMRNSNLTILGIDPGIGRVGYGVVRSRGADLSLLTYGAIETPKNTAVGDRLATINRQVRHLIATHAPDRIAVERLYFSKNVTTAMVVGEARGVILLAAADAHIPVVEYSPSVVKQSLTGYGTADKRQMQRMVQVIFKLKELPRPDDAADAVAIALCGSHPQLA